MRHRAFHRRHPFWCTLRGLENRIIETCPAEPLTALNRCVRQLRWGFRSLVNRETHHSFVASPTMLLSTLFLSLFLLAARLISAQGSSASDDLASPSTITGSIRTSTSISTASVSYVSPSGPQTVVYFDGSSLETSVIDATNIGESHSNSSATSSISSASSTSQSTSTSTGSLLGITGAAKPTDISNTTATASSRPQSSNSRRCNGYVELCDRKLSNVSMVVAHNSPFVVPHNAASNQVYPVINQLQDGIRGCKSHRFLSML